jgi:pumilio family protein 6
LLTKSTSDKSKALDALLVPISTPYTPLPPDSDPSDPTIGAHILNLSYASRTYKTLIQGGPFNLQTKQIECVDGAPKDVANAFVHAAGQENIVAMAFGDEAFLVAELIGKMKEEGDEKALKEIGAWFGKDVKKKLGKEGKKGSTVLLERLA